MIAAVPGTLGLVEREEVGAWRTVGRLARPCLAPGAPADTGAREVAAARRRHFASPGRSSVPGGTSERAVLRGAAQALGRRDLHSGILAKLPKAGKMVHAPPYHNRLRGGARTTWGRGRRRNRGCLRCVPEAHVR